jgi:hypothetical protein
MKNIFSLLLLTPALALAQELPDEDWLCVSDGYSMSTNKNGKLENATLETNTLKRIFNPAKGQRDFDSDVWLIKSCTLESPIYRCRSEPRSPNIFLITGSPDDLRFWELNASNGSYISIITSLEDEPFVMVDFGNCTKV